MFERNRVDNATRQMQAANAEITLDHGRTLAGRIAVPATRTVFDALNSQDAFIDFETFDGERAFIAKAILRSARSLDAPAQKQLPATGRAGDDFDPHAVLGVQPGADAETLRDAYLQKSKTYHPDRFANVDLPEEVRAYLQTTARRINIAYEALHAALPAVKAVRSEPIWESRRRA
jgi:hypothetical protein